MRKYIIKRLLYSVIILFFVAFIIYALMRCLPTSYIETIARQRSMSPGSKSYEEWMQQLTAMYNMDKGIIPGFFAWLGSMLRGEFRDLPQELFPVPLRLLPSDTVHVQEFFLCDWQPGAHVMQGPVRKYDKGRNPFLSGLGGPEDPQPVEQLHLQL